MGKWSKMINTWVRECQDTLFIGDLVDMSEMRPYKDPIYKETPK